jgi:hypothetical protein
MRRIVARLNCNCIPNKRTVRSVIARLASDERIIEHPEHPALAEIDGKGGVRSEPSRVGVEELISFRPSHPSLRDSGSGYA